MTTNVVECKDCAYSREANVPNAVFCMLNHQTFPIPVYGCTNGRTGKIVPQTNYDRLISKTPEELAEWIMCEPCRMHSPIGYYAVCPPGTWGDCPTRPCEQCWTDWLKSPVEVDNGT